jgi:hypothetical protein
MTAINTLHAGPNVSTPPMSARIDYRRVSPDAMSAMVGLERFVRTSGLEPGLVTEIARTGVPDDVYDQTRAEFSESELVALTMAIIAINGWSRLAVSFRTVPGTYQPRRTRHATAAVG